MKGGRCEACSGDGVVKVEMHFLADVYVPCEACAGKRYNAQTLAIRFKGKNIAEVLDLSASTSARSSSRTIVALRRILETLRRWGSAT